MRYRSPSVLMDRKIIHIMRYLEGGPVHSKPETYTCKAGHTTYYEECQICKALPRPLTCKEAR